jgi:hypothetical protein
MSSFFSLHNFRYGIEMWAAFALEGEHLTPIMSTDVNVPGQTAPHLVYED